MGVSSFRLDLPNGWTFSISDEMRPFVCNVAAWPTEDDEVRATDHRWFEWADGRTDVRCASMGEVGELLKEVLTSDRPAARHVSDPTQ